MILKNSKKKPLKKLLWIIITVLIIATAIFKLKTADPSVSAELETVKRGNIDKFVEETAVVKLENETPVYAPQGGRIVELSADIGDSVKAGDIIAKFDDQALKLQIRTLELQKQSLSAQYEEAKKSTDEEEILRLKAQLKSAQSAYDNSQRIAENNRVLCESGAISSDSYQASLTSLAASEAALETAKTILAVAQKGASQNIKRQYQAQIAELEAKITQFKKDLGNLTIKAPIDGIIMNRTIEAGKTAQAGELLFEIGDKGRIYLESDILADDIKDIKEGLTVLIENDDMNIKDIKGSVRKIHPKAISKISELGIEQKRVPVEINISDHTLNLLSGYDMNVRIITESKKDVLLISDKSVFKYNGKDHVFINENGKAKLQEIVKGIESDEILEVTKGLKEGDQVIVSPDEKLENGANIKP